MEKLLQLTKVLLVAAGLLVGQSAWADEAAGSYVYFNDFENVSGTTATGSQGSSGKLDATIQGSGVFEASGNAKYGKVFHNAGGSQRTNYLKLPEDVLAHSATCKQLTIGFWVNMGAATDFFWSPIFSAYGAAPVDNANKYPMMACQARGVLQVNCAGWCDYVDAQNTSGTNYATSAWLDDKAWHYYTAVFEGENAYVYIDGVLKNQWLATTDYNNGSSDITDTTQDGLFTNGSLLKYVCLGGNQAWSYGDNDPAFMFDDVFITNRALSKADIDNIIASKAKIQDESNTIVGNLDYSSDYLTVSSNTITLSPGESYHYQFINHNSESTSQWLNWVLPVYNSSDERILTLRSDHWEDIKGTNAGCTSNFTWGTNNATFISEMNDATIDMTINYSSTNVLTVSCDITTENYKWSYSYTTDYTNSDITLDGNIKVALSVNRAWLEILDEGKCISVNVTSAGFATYVNNTYDLDFSASTIKAYKVKVTEKGKAVMTQLNQVPAATPMLLYAEGGATEAIPVMTGAAAVTENDLVAGTGAAVPNTAGEYTNMILNVVDDQIGFYFANGQTVAANRAYLHILTTLAPDAVGGGSRMTLVFADQETTGIAYNNRETITNNRETINNNRCFDLQGRRIAKPTKGMYIVNGKKVVIK